MTTMTNNDPNPSTSETKGEEASRIGEERRRSIAQSALEWMCSSCKTETPCGPCSVTLALVEAERELRAYEALGMSPASIRHGLDVMFAALKALGIDYAVADVGKVTAAVEAAKARVMTLEKKVSKLQSLALSTKALLGHQEHGRPLPLDWLRRQVEGYEQWLTDLAVPIETLIARSSLGAPFAEPPEAELDIAIEELKRIEAEDTVDHRGNYERAYDLLHGLNNWEPMNSPDVSDVAFALTAAEQRGRDGTGEPQPEGDGTKCPYCNRAPCGAQQNRDDPKQLRICRHATRLERDELPPLPTYHQLLGKLCDAFRVPGSPTFDEALADVKAQLRNLTTELATAGEVLGTVCVAATLRPNESLITPVEHAALDAIRAVLADRDNWYSQHQDEETWRRHAEKERDHHAKNNKLVEAERGALRNLIGGFADYCVDSGWQNLGEELRRKRDAIYDGTPTAVDAKPTPVATDGDFTISLSEYHVVNLRELIKCCGFDGTGDAAARAPFAYNTGDWLGELWWKLEKFGPCKQLKPNRTVDDVRETAKVNSEDLREFQRLVSQVLAGDRVTVGHGKWYTPILNMLHGYAGLSRAVSGLQATLNDQAITLTQTKAENAGYVSAIAQFDTWLAEQAEFFRRNPQVHRTFLAVAGKLTEVMGGVRGGESTLATEAKAVVASFVAERKEQLSEAYDAPIRRDAERAQAANMAALRAPEVAVRTESDCCIACLGREPQDRMIVCRTCGNKRCPRTTDHRLACSGSNEPGQLGEDVPIAADPDAPFSRARDAALEKSNNTYRPTSHWTARNRFGQLVEAQRSPRESGLAKDEVLYVTLDVGFGGSDQVSESPVVGPGADRATSETGCAHFAFHVQGDSEVCDNCGAMRAKGTFAWYQAASKPSPVEPKCGLLQTVLSETFACVLTHGHDGGHQFDSAEVARKFASKPIGKLPFRIATAETMTHEADNRTAAEESGATEPAPPTCAHCGESITDIGGMYMLALPQAEGLRFCMKHHARLWQEANVPGPAVLPERKGEQKSPFKAPAHPICPECRFVPPYHFTGCSLFSVPSEFICEVIMLSPKDDPLWKALRGALRCLDQERERQAEGLVDALRKLANLGGILTPTSPGYWFAKLADELDQQQEGNK